MATVKTKTKTAGVHFIHDDWRNLTIAVEFTDGDSADDIRDRFAAAAETAATIARHLAGDRRDAVVIQFPARA